MHITADGHKATLRPSPNLVELDFDARVNLFVGPNASGKSVLLKQMDIAFNGR